jgi:hypothetical protein
MKVKVLCKQDCTWLNFVQYIIIIIIIISGLWCLTLCISQLNELYSWLILL